ncbi:MAG: hypothetical protein C0518_15035, partial [Opitutus sp.]|nr:hypothetical protein [Opitutus sp.]
MIAREPAAMSRLAVIWGVLPAPGWLALLLVLIGTLVTAWIWARRARRHIRHLEAEHARLTIVAHHAVSAVLFTDADWRVRWVNPGFTRIFGVQPHEVLGQPVTVSVPGMEEDTPLWRGLRQAGLARLVFKGDLNVKWEGRNIAMDVETHPLLDAKGKVREFIVLLHDISARRGVEEELRQTTLLQEAILNGTDHMIIATRPDGTIVAFNRGAERMSGYRAIELLHQKTPAVLHVPEEIVARAAELSRELGRPVAPGFEVFAAPANLDQSTEVEFSLVRKDGSRLPAMVLVTAMRDRAGAIIGYMGVARDITELKKSQDELARRESELRFLLNCLPIGVHWTYFKDGRAVAFDNDGTCRITGLTHEELQQP